MRGYDWTYNGSCKGWVEVGKPFVAGVRQSPMQCEACKEKMKQLQALVLVKELVQISRRPEVKELAAMAA